MKAGFFWGPGRIWRGGNCDEIWVGLGLCVVRWWWCAGGGGSDRIRGVLIATIRAFLFFVWVGPWHQ